MLNLALLLLSTTDVKVPDALKPWHDWAIADSPQIACPQRADEDTPNPVCAFVTDVKLTLNAKGGTFTESVRLYKDDLIALPGDDKHWPTDVRASGKPALVIKSGDRPVAALGAGSYAISGTFTWHELPESLAVPEDAALLSLTVNGQARPFPSIDNGAVWLEHAGEDEREENRMEVSVSRLLDDSVPTLLTTRITLTAAGKAREVVLPNFLPEGFVAGRLQSPLPARLEKDGSLRVQLRPGEHDIEIDARAATLAKSFAPPKSSEPWPQDEIWVFKAEPAIRLVRLEGAPAVDPHETKLKDDWKSYPAYRVRSNEPLQLVQQQRGAEVVPPSQLQLDRTLWLNFDGEGYSLRDRVSGALRQKTRLDMNPPILLGKVSSRGDNLLISLAGDKRGVELREQPLAVVAEGTLAGSRNLLPAVGWDEDFSRVSATLHLPPGWRLLAANGVDHASDTWIDRWNTLDFFAVLLIAVTLWRLFDVKTAALVALLLLLSWTEPEAPRWVWAPLLATPALTLYAPKSKLDRWWLTLRWMTLIVFGLVGVSYLVDDVRSAIHPVLEQAGGGYEANSVTTADGILNPSAPPKGAAPDMDRDEPQAAGSLAGLSGKRMKNDSGEAMKKSKAPARQQQAYNELAPDLQAAVQTGAGVAEWSWRSTQLSWSGPVKRNQEVHLYYLSPNAGRVATLLRLLLFSYFCFLFVQLPRARWPHWLLTLAPALFLFAFASEARADFPPPALLDQLKARLEKPAQCQPHCAEPARLVLEVTPQTLSGRMQWNVAAPSVVALPGDAEQWLAQRVLVDGKPAEALTRSDSTLFLALGVGQHDVQFSGELPNRAALQLALPDKPHAVTLNVKGWAVEGVHDDGEIDDSLRLVRTEAASGSQSTLAAAQLPAYLSVTRRLHFGLTWEVETTVSRLTPIGASASLSLPLLVGESVTTPGVRSEGGKVLVTLAPTATGTTWKSVLTTTKTLVLTAGDGAGVSETWIIDPGAMWHVEMKGPPPMLNESATVFAPWPKETLTLSVDRPAAAPGQTLTIDRSVLVVQPGLRATDLTLTLHLVSSRGGEHKIALPPGAQVQSLTLGGIAQPVPCEDGALLVPLAPGARDAVIQLRLDQGISTFYHPPRIDVGTASVNSETNIEMPGDRWILWLSGPPLGPAVLFWGVVVVLFAIALALGRSQIVPVKTRQWFLLGIGLAQLDVLSAAFVFALLLTFGIRRRYGERLHSGVFDLFQIALVAGSAIGVALLVGALYRGLASVPNMDIVGHSSSATHLDWYQDRTGAQLPSPLVVSLDMFYYKVFIFLWACWLATFFLRFTSYAWQSFTSGGVWRRSSEKPKPPAPAG